MANNQIASTKQDVKVPSFKSPFSSLTDKVWKWLLLLPAVIIVLALLAGPTLWDALCSIYGHAPL